MPLTSAERSRRYRARHSYSPARSDYRDRFGTYEREPCCELLLERCLGVEKLLIHHGYFQTCPECRGEGRDRGYCRLPEHLITVCPPCHRDTHKELEGVPDYRMERDLLSQIKHLESI